MRLDKFLCHSTDLSRSQAKRLIKQGQIRVQAQIIKDAAFSLNPEDQVYWGQDQLHCIGLRYWMLHKPTGYECTHLETWGSYPSVLSLLKVTHADRLHTVGRLDADTSGLLLITDDGHWSHQITSPRYQCTKVYRAEIATPLTDVEAAKTACLQGIMLHGEKQPTRPAQLEIIHPTCIRLSVQEGRYHQVKRMLAALGTQVVHLHREQIGTLILDADLAPGQARALTTAEVQQLAEPKRIP
ncbi:16S rRNA pseudouridine516 synthase [Allopseudospirillum japonicum]|uniref:Pseudouridine synthase n=1 Tax=Allopseudospirillum japonicum TaxID=64971 RepID=A0A1H6RP00_9GAMM|nr:pseudouridine synthase [Allopseudospirillum japonicum]SEI56216.1 16S rRNA pseudouridine516 synthase [Allopseudospirillum japonicum]